MDKKSLLEEGLLASPSFMRDLKSFLSLPTDTLLAIAELGSKSEGFVGFPQAQSLNDRFNVPLDKAMRDLRMAEYLYHRVTDSGESVEAAVSQVVSIAPGIEELDSLGREKSNAIAAVLSFKRDYELADAKKRSSSSVPHFGTLKGSWSIKPVSTREGEIVKVPALAMSIAWHDTSGNNHEGFFYLTDRDWEEVSKALRSLDDERKSIEALL